MSSVFYSTAYITPFGVHRSRLLVAYTGLHPVLLILRPIRGFGEILKIGKNIAHFTVGVWNTDDADERDQHGSVQTNGLSSLPLQEMIC